MTLLLALSVALVAERSHSGGALSPESEQVFVCVCNSSKEGFAFWKAFSLFSQFQPSVDSTDFLRVFEGSETQKDVKNVFLTKNWS